MWGTNEELDLSTHVCHEAVSATLMLEGVMFSSFPSSVTMTGLSIGFSVCFKKIGKCLSFFFWGGGGKMVMAMVVGWV